MSGIGVEGAGAAGEVTAIVTDADRAAAAHQSRRIQELEAEIESERAGEALLLERAANVRARIEELQRQVEASRG